MNKKNKIIYLSISIFLLLVFIVGSTFAYWEFKKVQTNSNMIVSGCFDLTFEEEEDSSIHLSNTYPMLDNDGSKLKPYVVRVTNTCNNDLTYQLNLEVLKESDLRTDYLKVKVGEEEAFLLSSKDKTDITIKNAKEAYLLENGVILGNSTKDFEIRMWLKGELTADDEDSMNKVFTSKLSIIGSINHYSGRYTEGILNGTDPVLSEELIPVTIGQDGKVYKADINREWYKYEDKIWANEVILEDESITYQNNEEIPEDNIESYFVWIPRYRYQIFNDGLYYELSNQVENREQEIQIVFESKERNQVSDGKRKGDWLTHPAFTSFDVNGLWVGKFETGYKGATTTEGAQQNIVDTEKIQVRPNVYSWRGINVANAHLNSYNYKRWLDSHMMKNTEWGAVSYLSHSKYGSMASVRINNNGAYITGYAAVNEPTCGYTGENEECNKYEATNLGVDGTYTINYNNQGSLVASTTGNYSGVYDMSGGSWEYMMGVMADKNGNPVSGSSDIINSGFIGTLTNPSTGTNKSKISWTNADGGIPYPESKYYDLYAYGENDVNFGRRILGDATGEMGPFANVTYGTRTRPVGAWYLDQSWFSNNTEPWFSRGERCAPGVAAGLFTFAQAPGNANGAVSYRIVLAN